MNSWLLGISVWLIIVNLLAVASFGFDKRAARRGNRRISEGRLLQLALLGGSPGAFLASKLFRHKTHKQPFRTRLWWITGVQTLGVAALLMVFFFR